MPDWLFSIYIKSSLHTGGASAPHRLAETTLLDWRGKIEFSLSSFFFRDELDSGIPRFSHK
jgi:hypothetical protein